MKARIILTLTACLLVLGCTRDSGLYAMADYSGMNYFGGDRSHAEMIAYEHSLTIDVREDVIDAAYNSVVEACSSEQEFVCRVIDSSIQYGDYQNAGVSMRVEPAGIDQIAKTAIKLGTVVQRHTSTEDLTKTITDLDSRLSILKTTRDKLLLLEEDQTNDIDSLIKITTELTRIQGEIEQLTAQSAAQHQRVDMEVLSVRFTVDRYQSFWRPIKESFTEFGHRLSRGIADMVGAVAYLLPWSVLLVGIGLLARLAWKRRRQN